eukprot:405645_1
MALESSNGDIDTTIKLLKDWDYLNPEKMDLKTIVLMQNIKQKEYHLNNIPHNILDKILEILNNVITEYTDIKRQRNTDLYFTYNTLEEKFNKFKCLKVCMNLLLIIGFKKITNDENKEILIFRYNNNNLIKCQQLVEAIISHKDEYKDEYKDDEYTQDKDEQIRKQLRDMERIEMETMQRITNEMYEEKLKKMKIDDQEISNNCVQQLTSMGFEINAAKNALKISNNNIETAIDFLMDEDLPSKEIIDTSKSKTKRCHPIKNCPSIHNIAKMLCEYEQTNKCSTNNTRICNKSEFVDIYNDYCHILLVHGKKDLETIMNFMKNKYNVDCNNISSCLSIRRNYRDRSKDDLQRYKHLYLETDTKHVHIIQFLDIMHNFCFHTHHLNYSLTQNDKQKIYCNYNDNKDDDKDDDNNYQEIKIMRNILKENSKRLAPLLGSSRIDRNKFITNFREISDDNTMLDTIYDGLKSKITSQQFVSKLQSFIDINEYDSDSICFDLKLTND